MEYTRGMKVKVWHQKELIEATVISQSIQPVYGRPDLTEERVSLQRDNNPVPLSVLKIELDKVNDPQSVQTTAVIHYDWGTGATYVTYH